MSTSEAPPIWLLRLKVLPLRFLTNFSFFLGKFVRPRPPQPSRTIRIPRSIVEGESENGTKKRSATNKEPISLQIYYPSSDQQSLLKAKPIRPVVVNFHGSGFMLGHATDDARWARSVTEYAGAVVVSVEYRLAPENTYPAAVDDGLETLLWIISHSEELGVDPHRIAMSGFSAGGSLAFGVPMRLGEEMRKRSKLLGAEAQTKEQCSDSRELGPYIDPRYRIVFIAAWYPSVDYSLTRPQRRATNVRQDKNLPAWFTNLVDTSFLLGVDEADKKSPWLSPAQAPVDMLRKYLPHDIVVRVCEWDELRAEAERFYKRLISEEVGRQRVGIKVVEKTTHGWDKHPNFKFKWDETIEEAYRERNREEKNT
ncbi:Alpha/Beta hydrolase protein [Lentinula aciculospora]|uniref:Alpha/Beta hydrolase protein n=1 Tax=Lentinula aciculospora TaxID=153920 RepID=A0A9W9AEE3_9AGAR|nr:Alpha/Beta hydrolase protein [Lentinula aciculospora]